MSEARTAILSAIRRSLGRDELSVDAAAELELALSEPKARILPQVGNDVVEHFLVRAQALAMTIARVVRRADVPAAAAEYVRNRRLPNRLVVAAALQDLTWPDGFEVRHGATRREDPVSVTDCFAAVAETGSLVLTSGPATPTTLNFTPDDMIAVLAVGDIAAHQEVVWQRLRRERAALPRTVNFVSGPSRTADIEQVVQLGVHGPRRVHVILVETPG
jgi:L-lactate dehydrogenase complex protein LldG